MRIGIAAPVATSDIVDLLGSDASDLPIGYSGAPMISVLARALLDRGHHVSLFTTDSTLFGKAQEPRKFSGKRLNIYYCPSRPSAFRFSKWTRGRILDFFKIERQGLQAAISVDQPDIMHAHWGYEFAWAALDSNVPHLISFHDAPRKILRHMPNLYRLGRYAMARRTVRDARHLTTVSPYMQEELFDWCGRRMELVPNPVGDEWFSSALSAAGRSLKQPRIAMVLNGWNSLKNPEPALEAFMLIRGRIPDAQLHLFGTDFGANGRAQKWLESRFSSDNVTFHGLLPYKRLRMALAGMTLMIHPAIEESFSMSLAEAMALGLPVVGGDASGAVPWVCDNGNAGALVDIRNARKIAEAVLSILSDSKKYVEISAHAKTAAETRFSVSSVVDRYESAYDKILSKAIYK